MFTAHNLKEWMNAQPFNPFRVHMSDGKMFDVTNHDMLFVSRNFIEIGLDTDREGLSSRLVNCAIIHITQIEKLQAEQVA